MKPEHELELSFFEELSSLDDKGKVFLVKDMRDDTIHVKKILSKDVMFQTYTTLCQRLKFRESPKSKLFFPTMSRLS